TVIVDANPPQVVSATPTPGSTGVSTATNLIATFSESVVASSISFSLIDANNQVIPATLSYSDATHTVTLSTYNALSPSMVYTATVSGAVDLTGTTMTNPYSWTFTTNSVISGATIFGSNAVPVVAATNDSAAIEVGVKFTASVSGFITGLRFYKGVTNTGTHVGHLWSSTGTLLATATFTNESASGWQQVNFNTPVAIAANTIYVASYFAPNGNYAGDGNYFTAAVGTGVLQAPASVAGNGN